MRDKLTQTEKDFIEFLSLKKDLPSKDLVEIYLATKKRFKFSGQKYRKLCDDIHNLFKIIYNDVDEKGLIKSYKFHEVLHLFRFISYTYQKPISKYLFIKTLIWLSLRGDFRKIFSFIKSKGFDKNKDYKMIAKSLVENMNGLPPLVVDYGCGLGEISFEIGKLNQNSKIYLVDIDCLTLEFAEFRFKKYGIDVEIIPVSENDLYPKLPQHNICIANDVMEHIMKPLVVYKNISIGMSGGGYLYGNFNNQRDEMFHISTNLNELREQIDKDFHKLDDRLFKKIK